MKRILLMGLLLSLVAAVPASAQLPTVLRIGTGGVGGTYFPVGLILATALSDATGGPGCAEAACGVPGVFAVAQVSNGSVANVEALGAGLVELALVQSNVADWAYRAAHRFAERPPFAGLRAIASLYVETVHLVTRPGAGIGGVSDLAGRGVSLDEPGSGTLLDARELLPRFGIGEADLKPEYVKPNLALDLMKDGRIDAFFISAGFPVGALAEAGQAGTPFTLVPISGAGVDRLIADHPGYTRAVVPAGVYPGVPETPTVGVSALLLTRADLDEELVYGLTKALWSQRTRHLLDQGHPKGRDIRAENAFLGIPLPLHPGAERFYREAGLIR